LDTLCSLSPPFCKFISNRGGAIEKRLAKQVIDGVVGNAFVSLQFAQRSGIVSESVLLEIVEATEAAVEATKRGGTAQADALLTSQAITLNAVFLELSRRAAKNMGEYPAAMERYLRLALKAQAQCRTTLESLAEIRNPKSVAFVRQANIAGGHQQINNGSEVAQPQQQSREQTNFDQNKVLEDSANGQWLDYGTPAEAGRRDPIVATLGQVDRSQDRSGEGEGG